MTEVPENQQIVFAILSIAFALGAALIPFIGAPLGGWLGIARGLLVGAALAAFGYIKSCTIETFDPQKFVLTIILGLLSGVFVTVLGMDPASFETFLTQSGIVIWIDYLVKVVWRRVVAS